MRKTVSASLAMALLLSACGSSEKSGDGEGASAGEAAAPGGKLEMKPGLYKITTNVLEMNMEGVPPQLAKEIGGGIKATDITECLTEADAEKALKQVNEGEGKGACTYKTFEINGTNFKSEIVCTSPRGDTTIKGEGTIANETWDYIAETQAPGMKMKAHVTATRTGECTAAPKAA